MPERTRRLILQAGLVGGCLAVLLAGSARCAAASPISPGVASAAALGVTQTGRWKWGGDSCYWDEYDSGPDQCDPNDPPPPTGRYKLDGTGCNWDPNDSGPPQCDPNGHFKLDSTGCYWDDNTSGANECDPTTGRYKITGEFSCEWTENDPGPNQCDPSAPTGRYTVSNVRECDLNSAQWGTSECSPQQPPGRYLVNSSGQCEWMPNDWGPNLCEPTHPSGRYKLSGTECVWTEDETGPDQCTPPDAPAAQCVVTLSANVLMIDPDGQAGQFDLTVPSGCAWQITKAPAWLTITPSYGVGSTALAYSVDAGSDRVGTLAIEGTGSRAARAIVDQGSHAPYQPDPGTGSSSGGGSCPVGSLPIQVPSQQCSPGINFCTGIVCWTPPQSYDACDLFPELCAPNRVPAQLPGGGGSTCSPRLTVSPAVVTRADSATFVVSGASGATIAGWTFEALDSLAATVTDPANDGSYIWSGPIVATGLAKVTVTCPGGSPTTLSQPITVAARDWHTTPVPAERRYAGQPMPNGGLFTFSNPASGNGYIPSGVGFSDLRLTPSVTPADVGTIADGPNKGLKYLLEVHDDSEFAWGMHDDVENLNSFWQQLQFGGWTASAGSTCTSPIGSGWQSASDFRDGIARHESAPINSHYAFYTTELANYDFKASVEGFVRSVGTSPNTVAIVARALMVEVANDLHTHIASHGEPCGGYICSASCADYLGVPNVFPYKSELPPPTRP